MEIKFPQGKQVVSTYIKKDGEITSKYITDQSPDSISSSKSIAEDKHLTFPSVGILSVDLSKLDDTTKQAFIAARRQYFNYFTQGYIHRQDIFRWQLLSSEIIFIIVVILVFSGITFAAIQFYNGMKKLKNQSEEVTTFEAGTGGIKVSSPVLGVIILVISLAFFYLYLAYVYPIREIF